MSGGDPICSIDPGAHHGDAVAERQRLVLVVGDEDRRHADPLEQPADVAAQLPAQSGVEAGERLVEQDHAWLRGERPGQGDPLLLASRQRAGHPRRPCRRARRGRARRCCARHALRRGERRSRHCRRPSCEGTALLPGTPSRRAVSRPATPRPEVTSRSPMTIRPAVGVSSPAMQRSNVVLPHPDGPRRARISPATTPSETSWSTVVDP